MRELLAALALTACVSAQTAPTQTAPSTGARTPYEIARGCWIDQRDRGEAITLRWLPDHDDRVRLNGAMLSYGPQGPFDPAFFWIDRTGPAWRFCSATDSCWPIGEAAARPHRNGGIEYFDVEGGAERLTLSFVYRFGDEWEREFLFQGARHGCD